MEGISQLADCLFGLTLRVEPVEPGECWHPSVVKIGVYGTSRGTVRVGEDDGLIGLIYCDLLDRPGKPAQVSWKEGMISSHCVCVAVAFTCCLSTIQSMMPIHSEWVHTIGGYLAYTQSIVNVRFLSSVCWRDHGQKIWCSLSGNDWMACKGIVILCYRNFRTPVWFCSRCPLSERSTARGFRSH